MEEQQRKKLLAIKVGVAVLMVLIFVAWGANVKKAFQYKDGFSAETQAWEDIKAALSNDFDEIASDTEEISDQVSQSVIWAKSESLADDLLRAAQEKAEENAEATSTAAATTTQPVVLPINSIGCPAYVNCMPTIGQAPNCSIPSGCEGVTELVY